MNYMIHNERCIQSENQRQEIRKLVRRQVGRLTGRWHNLPNTMVIDLYLNKSEDDFLQVSAILNLRGRIIYMKEEGKVPEAIFRKLFEGIMLKMTRTINHEKREHLSDRKDRQYNAFIENLSELRNLKKEEAREVFNRLIRVISGDVARYIRRRLKSAEMTTAVKRGVFKIQELLDELFLLAYEQLEEVPEGEDGIRSWLYRMADDLLRQKLLEIEFEKAHFKELDALVEAEYKFMAEEPEEANEFSGEEEWYQADSLLYGENEDTLLDDITLKLNQQEIHRLIEKELAKLPVRRRTIMDLYLINQMGPEEIAEVKKIPVKEVETVVREVSRDLSKKLFFLIS